MLIISFFQWWYGKGWKQQLNKLPSGIKGVVSAFSVQILLRTMFDPWKQIITQSFTDTALDDKLKALADNVISRTIGFFVRTLTLIVALMAILANLIYRTIILAVWPILPIGPIILLIGAFAELVS